MFNCHHIFDTLNLRPYNIGGSIGGAGTYAPFDPISFIFMQFSAKSCQIIRFWPKLIGWRSPLRNRGSPTV